MTPWAMTLGRRSALLGALLAAGARARAQGQVPGDAPVTVAVFGDSQAQGLAQMLARALRGNPGFRLVNRTKPATAIGTPTSHDWVHAVEVAAAADRPAIAVMMFGGNDRVPARPLSGPPLPFRSEAWLTFYRDRIAAMLRALSAAGSQVVWCGNPICREANYARDMAFLNGLYQEALTGPGHRFLDLWSLVADGRGQYVSHGPGPDGSVQRLRLDDGIHFTVAGYEVLARRVVQELTSVVAELRGAQPPRAVPAQSAAAP